MRDIRIAAAQFEGRDGDKPYNLGRIDDLTAVASKRGAELVCFHEMSVSNYSYIQPFGRDELLELAEAIPDGPSTVRLIQIADAHGVALSAGILELDEGHLYNTQVVVTADGLVAKHRKLHAFINPHIASGDSFTVFELCGCTMGMLTCYDNNLPENVRITALMGAEIILMPHVTCGLDSPMPGRGRIPREVWENRERDPARCRLEFMGPKARGWLMRWLPARAYENGIYAVFTNPVGIDYDTVKNGNAMILDPYGEVVVESNALGDDVVVGLCTPDKIQTSSGRRYLRARRPDLYAKLVEPPPADQPPTTSPGWALEKPTP